MHIARKHLHLAASRPLTPRPPSTPDEIDDPHHEVLVWIGRAAAMVLLVLFVFFATVAVLGLQPAETTVRVQR